jgi:hypothetical protein
MDDDYEEFGLGEVIVLVQGLAPGDYRVFTYAWHCGYGNRVRVTPSADPFVDLGTPCVYPGLVRGLSYALHRVFQPPGGGLVRIEVQPIAGAGGSVAGLCQGFQIVQRPGELFCAGDGIDPSVTPCPCGNAGVYAHGCAHSGNPSGAFLDAYGTRSFDDVSLRAEGMPGTSTCIYLQGDQVDNATFGDGVRCAGGTLVRLRVRANVGGASTFPDATDTVTLSQRGGVVPGSGVTRLYQTYYRNAAAAFCPPETFNVTNGVRVEW